MNTPTCGKLQVITNCLLNEWMNERVDGQFDAHIYIWRAGIITQTHNRAVALEGSWKCCLKVFVWVLTNVLVNNADTFTNNSNNNISKDFFERRLCANSFHILSCILSVLLSQQTLNAIIFAHLFCARHGTRWERGGVSNEQRLGLCSQGGQLLWKAPGVIATLSLWFLFPSYVICRR